MGRKESESNPTTLRIKTVSLKRAREYANRHHLQPTLTQIFDAAIAEYLDKHWAELPADASDKRLPRPR